MTQIICPRCASFLRFGCIGCCNAYGGQRARLLVVRRESRIEGKYSIASVARMIVTFVNLCALVVVVGSISFLCVAVDGACFFFWSRPVGCYTVLSRGGLIL